MTEKQGGSDVRANTTTATAIPSTSNEYELLGHKVTYSLAHSLTLTHSLTHSLMSIPRNKLTDLSLCTLIIME